MAATVKYLNPKYTEGGNEPKYITILSSSSEPDLSNYLAKDNTTKYEPTGDYNPATKKYVDDNKLNHQILTESEYSALGTTPETDNVLYFVTPD